MMLQMTLKVATEIFLTTHECDVLENYLEKMNPSEESKQELLDAIDTYNIPIFYYELFEKHYDYLTKEEYLKYRKRFLSGFGDALNRKLPSQCYVLNRKFGLDFDPPLKYGDEMFKELHSIGDATIQEILINGVNSTERRNILANSLFYYCCGKDITPICAFANKCPLFIYADIVDYGQGDFFEETGALYKNLESKGYVCQKKITPEKQGKIAAFSNFDITRWKDTEENVFYLVYVQGDAEKVFRNIYADNGNYIQPRCICNYRYEFEGVNPLGFIEKRAEFILGHCHSDKYEVAGECIYGGNDTAGPIITLYRRAYWYVY